MFVWNILILFLHEYNSNFVYLRTLTSTFTNIILIIIIFQANKWKKRGMSLVPMRYDHGLKGKGLKIQCLISIFADDGTISVSTAGIEMGQGLNTKVKEK